MDSKKGRPNCTECGKQLEKGYVEKPCPICRQKLNKQKRSSKPKVYSKSKPKKVNQKSDKQKVEDRELSKAYAKKKETHSGGCEGCNCFNRRIMPSHRIRRSRRKDLVTQVENIDLLCDLCGDHVEAFRFHLLTYNNLGTQILEYIERVDQELYNLIIQKDNFIFP